MAIRFQLGASARIRVTTQINEADADPTTLTLTLTNPAGTQTTHVHGTDVNVIKEAIGRYYYDKTLDVVGTWRWRWVAAGVLTGADSGQIVVRTVT